MIDWTDYLYRRYSREELGRWARSLAYFRFCRAYGGHNNDGDHLLVCLDSAEFELGHTQIAGRTVFTYPQSGRFMISVSDGYEVTESCVASAMAIEEVLRPLESRIIDPPQDDTNCICPRYYPDLWM